MGGHHETEPRAPGTRGRGVFWRLTWISGSPAAATEGTMTDEGRASAGTGLLLLEGSGRKADYLCTCAMQCCYSVKLQNEAGVGRTHSSHGESEQEASPQNKTLQIPTAGERKNLRNERRRARPRGNAAPRKGGGEEERSKGLAQQLGLWLGWPQATWEYLRVSSCCGS